MFDMRKLIDTMGEQAQRDRSRYHLTLGKLRDFLEKCNGDSIVEVVDQDKNHEFSNPSCVINPHSYRGYYCDLSFEITDKTKQTCAELLKIINGCLGETFTGWKGGDFTMDSDTSLWISEEGCCWDLAIINVVSNEETNTVTLTAKSID